MVKICIYIYTVYDRHSGINMTEEICPEENLRGTGADFWNGWSNDLPVIQLVAKRHSYFIYI